MATDDPSLLDSDRLRIGRLLFDGAEPAAIAKRYGLTVEEVDAVWLFCREALSRHFAVADDKPFCLLNDEGLVERRLETLRLLLDWRQALLDQQLARSFSVETDTD